MRTMLAAAAALSFAALATAGTVTNSFDTAGDVMLSPTQAPGMWYTDRYAPGVFAGGATGGGRTGVLHHGVRAADAAANRPNGQQGSFYDYQGRKYDVGLTGGVQTIAIDLFVDSASDVGVNAGIWGTTSNSNNSDLYYPILAYRQSATAAYDAGFYFFDTFGTNGGGWLEVLTGVSGQQWNELEIVFTVGTGYEVLINGLSVFTYADTTSEVLENIILNQYNFGVDQDVYWDNFVASDDGTAIPLPTAGGLAFAGLIGLGARRRRSA
ncbi:MAG: VPLPA-CTERM sorting domain-containing protein [Phycisphaerales bacterium]